MSGGSPKYPGLIRISKTGEMRLKNKVANAILKENTYEERALRTKLQTIKKHQDRNDRYLAHKQLEFATSKVSATEERPSTTGSNKQDSACGDIKALSLPPIHNANATRMAAARSASRSTPEPKQISSDSTGSGKSTGKWEKAITLVRAAVSQRRQRNHDQGIKAQGGVATENSVTLTASLTARSSDKEMNFPPIASPTAHLISRDGRRRKKGLQRQLTFPEMIKTSRKKAQLGLQDPRFQRLEQCLQDSRECLLSHRDSETKRRPSNNRASHFNSTSGH